MPTHVKINENPLLPLVAFVVVIIGVLVVIIVVAIVAIIVIVIGVSVSSSSFSIPHCHSGTTLPFLLLPLLLAMACYSGFPGVFALLRFLRCSHFAAIAAAVPVSGSACTARFFRLQPCPKKTAYENIFVRLFKRSMTSTRKGWQRSRLLA